MENVNLYLLTTETYESTTIYGIFSDKSILLEKYLYLLEHDYIAHEYTAPHGACIYQLQNNVAYIDSYYEICDGGLEYLGSSILEVDPVDIWGNMVKEKIAASRMLAQMKAQKEHDWIQK